VHLSSLSLSPDSIIAGNTVTGTVSLNAVARFGAAPAVGRVLPPAPSDSGATTTPAAPASVAALAEIPPVTETLPGQPRDQVIAAPDRAGVPKSATQKPRPGDQDAQRITPPNPVGAKRPPPGSPGLGGLLRHLFTERAGTSYYPN
jgi:hypothetical protein